MIFNPSFKFQDKILCEYWESNNTTQFGDLMVDCKDITGMIAAIDMQMISLCLSGISQWNIVLFKAP